MEKVVQKDNTLKYQYVRETLVDAIKNGVYEPGEQLPAERTLVSTFNVSHPTIRQALYLLEQDGYIKKLPGKGNYVAENIPQLQINVLTEQGSVVWLNGEFPKISRQKLGEIYQSPFANHEFEILYKLLSKNGKTLSLAYANTRSLAEDGLPFALTQGNVAGVILDGYVTDYHVKFIQDHGFPVVVAGNCPVQLPVHKVTINYYDYAYNLTKLFFENGYPELRCILGPPELRNAICPDFADGYFKACSEEGAVNNYRVLGKLKSDVVSFKDSFKGASGRFGLYINYALTFEIDSLYKELGFNYEDNPVIFSIQDETLYNPDIADKVSYFITGSELYYKIAAELIDDAIAGNKPKHISMEPELSAQNIDGILKLKLKWIRKEMFGY